MPQILYDTKTLNFTTGADNCASKIYKLLQCVCTDLFLIKLRNGNLFYKVEILNVDTFGCILHEINWTFGDFFD